MLWTIGATGVISICLGVSTVTGQVRAAISAMKAMRFQSWTILARTSACIAATFPTVLSVYITSAPSADKAINLNITPSIAFEEIV